MSEQFTFYTRQSSMSSPGPHEGLFEALPHDIDALIAIVQSLVVYEDVAKDFYGYEFPAERANEKHLRSMQEMVDRLLALDGRPLTEPRPVEKRLAGRCHHFMLLLLSMLRAKGIPARGRCGFGAYFNPGYFEDHWVVEYWNPAEQRWMLADPQFDEIWRDKLHIQHDVLDVPRDQFLVAAAAWQQCRAGTADPSTFGIVLAQLRGLWYVAGNVVRDVAALNAVELLPWDVWGAQPEADATLAEDQLEFFDELAGVTIRPDDSFAELRALYASDHRVRVPATVFNALLRRPEPLNAAG